MGVKCVADGSAAGTGSTDDTEAIIKETMGGVPGQLLRATFVDFSQVLDWQEHCL